MKLKTLKENSESQRLYVVISDMLKNVKELKRVSYFLGNSDLDSKIEVVDDALNELAHYLSTSNKFQK